MKKILTVLLIGITVNLYAEVSIGASIDMSIIPFQFIKNEQVNEIRYFGAPEQEEYIFGAGLGRYGSGQGARARLDVRASHDDTIGMRARIQARTDGIAIEDYLQAWWKPTSYLRVDAGRFFDDRLRGKVNDLDERMNGNNVRMYDGDAIFTRFRTHRSGGQAGLMISATPVENLFVGALLYDLKPFTAPSSSLTDSAMYNAHPSYVNDNANAWQNIQIAAGYSIPGIGLARAQYFGTKPRVDITRVSDEIIDDNNLLLYSYMFDTFAINAPKIEAAFAFTAIPGLLIDIGGKIPLPFKNWDLGTINIFDKEDEALLDAIYKSYRRGFVWQAPYQASFGIKFTPQGLDELEIAGRIDAKFLGYMKGNIDEIYFAPEVNIHIWPSWNFSFARIIFDAGFEYIGATYNKNGILVGEGSPVALNGGYRFGLGVSIQKNFAGNSLIKGGITYKFAGRVNGVRENGVLSIPLYVDLSF
ncbi:MAG: hypothetical protein FWD13_11900 [Treponema sp.]|nr:hypothetical protein [Treponema sp.]